MSSIHTLSAEIAGKTLSFETGKLALQADGAVMATYGDIIILATAGMGDTPRAGIDFFPMMVDYDAKFYSMGKMKSSRFMKREGRPTDSAILNSRMIDRPLRPLFPKNTRNDVQIITTLLQTNAENTPVATAINAASLACLVGGLPLEAPVGAVRVGMKEDGSYFFDPTFEEVKTGKLDLILAGTEDSVMMVEAGGSLVSNEEMIKAFEFGHKEIKKICALQKEFLAKLGDIKQREPILLEHDENAKVLVEKAITDAEFDTIQGKLKHEIKGRMHELEDKMLEIYSEEIENEEVTKKDLLYFFDKKYSESLRRRVFEKQERIDGRGLDEIRPLSSFVHMFPRLHGSGLFQRGETQSLSIATVAGPEDVLIQGDADQPEIKKQYFHHYNFPPYSVGEVRPLRGTGRREIGHGMLGERALQYVMPTKEDDYPYTVRIVSEILTCNGSSSMAAVCGSTLALMDAGVPLKKPISGIAMGLMINEKTGAYHILTDIMSFEDFGGDMDFKVTGDENGITALQLDIKVKGLDLSLLAEALEKAQVARGKVLDVMLKEIPETRKEMSEFAPRVESLRIDPEYIGAVIGKGGSVIQGLSEDFGVEINIEDDGLVFITSSNQEGAIGARKAIEGIVYEPTEGDVFTGPVKSIMDFGAFVEYLPGKDALVHVSEISEKRVNHPSDELKQGQMVTVKYLGSDKMGRVKLTMKGVEQVG